MLIHMPDFSPEMHTVLFIFGYPDWKVSNCEQTTQHAQVRSSRHVWWWWLLLPLLDPVLSVDIFLESLSAYSTCCWWKIGACPQRWKLFEYWLKFLPKKEGCIPLQFLGDFWCAIARPYSHKEMDMIRLNCQWKNRPPLLFAFCGDELLSTIFEVANKNSLSSLWAPNEMVRNQMGSVFISQVNKLTLICHLHLGNIQ